MLIVLVAALGMGVRDSHATGTDKRTCPGRRRRSW